MLPREAQCLYFCSPFPIFIFIIQPLPGPVRKPFRLRVMDGNKFKVRPSSLRL